MCRMWLQSEPIMLEITSYFQAGIVSLQILKYSLRREMFPVAIFPFFKTPPLTTVRCGFWVWNENSGESNVGNQFLPRSLPLGTTHMMREKTSFCFSSLYVHAPFARRNRLAEFNVDLFYMSLEKVCDWLFLEGRIILFVFRTFRLYYFKRKTRFLSLFASRWPQLAFSTSAKSSIRLLRIRFHLVFM